MEGVEKNFYIASDSDFDNVGIDIQFSDDTSEEEAKEPLGVTFRKQNGGDRLPTRRPDPNIYNRNALLARENRRRKKAYLENVEKELEQVRRSNSLLLKALKKSVKVRRRLEQEKQYFKNIVENRTNIFNLISALNSQLQSNRSQTLFSTKSAICESSTAEFPSEYGENNIRCNVSMNGTKCFKNSESDFGQTGTDNTWCSPIDEGHTYKGRKK